MNPMIGIVTANEKQGGLGGNRANFRRIEKAAQRLGAACPVYAIEPDGAISVYTSGESARFTPVQAELPKVLYNRIPTRRLERSPAVAATLRNWENAGRIITNPRFLRKDEVLSLWQSQAALQPYVPYAETLRSAEQVIRFLTRYGTVYVKPIDGKAGVGIVHLQRKGKMVVMRLQRAGRAELMAQVGAQEAAKKLMLRARPGTCVLQVGADVARLQGRRFDFRILAHAQSSGRMAITGSGIRLGPAGGFTTHVPNGGQILKPATVLKQVFGNRAEAVEEKVQSVAEIAARLLHRQPGVWCELSLDVGLTRDGEPLLFEANAKPMKFDEVVIEREAKRQLVTYLLTLAK